MNEKIKVNLPPKGAQFQKNRSGNPTGKRRTNPPVGVADAILRKVREPIAGPTARRGRSSRYELGARALVVQAAQGDRRALAEVIKFGKRSSRNGPELRKVSFQEAFKKKGADKLTPEFFDQQAKDKAEFRRKAKEMLTMGDYVEKELRRRVKMPRGDRMVRMSMQDVIAHNLSNDVAKGDITAIALLEKISPGKSRRDCTVFTEVIIPAVKDVGDDLKTTQSTSFGRLLGLLLDDMTPDLAAVKDALDSLDRLFNRTEIEGVSPL